MPAITRSSVLLPLPDGPSSATTSPEPMVSDMPSSTRVSPNATLIAVDLDRRHQRPVALAALAGAERVAGGELDECHEQDRDRREHRGQHVPLRLQDRSGAPEQLLDHDRHRLVARA